jgi:hypothetical protein
MSMSRALKAAGSMAAAAGLAAAIGFSPAGAAIAALSPPVSDVSPPTQVTIEIGNIGRVVDRGLTVYVPVTVTCSLPGGQTSTNFNVRERVGNQIASASGYTQSSVPCNGQPQRLLIRADAFTVPFRVGSALATVDAYACGGFGPCAQVTARKNVFLF